MKRRKVFGKPRIHVLRRRTLGIVVTSALVVAGGCGLAQAAPSRVHVAPPQLPSVSGPPHNNRYEWQVSAETPLGTVYSVYDTGLFLGQMAADGSPGHPALPLHSEGSRSHPANPGIRSYDFQSRVILVPPSGPPRQLSWHLPTAPSGCGDSSLMVAQLAVFPSDDDMTQKASSGESDEGAPRLSYAPQLLPWIQWANVSEDHVIERALKKGRAFVGPTRDGWFEFDKASKKLIKIVAATDTETYWGTLESAPQSYSCSAERFAIGHAAGSIVSGTVGEPGVSTLDTGKVAAKLHSVSDTDIVYSIPAEGIKRSIVRQPSQGGKRTIPTSATDITSAAISGESLVYTGWVKGRPTPNAWLVQENADPRELTENETDFADKVWAGKQGLKLLHRKDLSKTWVETISPADARTARRMPPPSLWDVSIDSGTSAAESITWATDHEIADWRDEVGMQKFDPLGRMTRGTAAAWMYRFAGSPAVTAPQPTPVSDISPGDADYDAIMWALQRHLIEPRDINGTQQFRRSDSLERGEAAEMAYAYAGKPDFTPPAELAFTDVAEDHEHFRAITWYWLGRLDVEGRRSTTKFGPDDPWQRKEAAVALRKLSEITPWQGTKK